VQVSTGRFSAFCDDDDLWTRNDHLSLAVRALEENALDLFFAEMAKIGEEDVRVRRSFQLPTFI
jgi:hypothetical protein